MKILLLEDDLILSDIIFSFLEKNGHYIALAKDGKKALQLLDTQRFDLGIFDINVPIASGLEVLKDTRFFKKKIPIIMITAYLDTAYLKEAFELGCDDYIKKPFDLEELSLRIQNIAKKFALVQEVAIGTKMTFNLTKRSVLNQTTSQTTHLSQKESQILSYMLTHQNRVISFDELIQNIWINEEPPMDTTIRIYIKNLRLVIGMDKIKNLRGEGYILEP